MTTRAIFLILALGSGLMGTLSAVDDPANQSDFRFQPGSVSVSNTTLRSRVIGNFPEATPRTELSFTIQQNGFAPTVTNVPYFYQFTNNDTGISYTVSRGSQNIMGTTNSTWQSTTELFPLDAMPFGPYTLRIILDKDAEVCDRNRNNNTVVVSSLLNYVPTPSFRIFEFDVAGHTFLGNGSGTLKRFSAGETITLNYSISNLGENLPSPTSMRVDFYLTTIIPTTQQRQNNLPNRTVLFGDPDTRFLGWDMGFVGNGNSASFNIPADLEHLQYSVAAIANSDLVVPERTAGNATPIGFQTEEPFEILYVFNRPDLIPSATVSLSSTSLTTFDSLNIVSSVRNIGNMPSPSTLMHHYLERNSSIGTSSVRYLLGTSTVPPIAQAPVEGASSSLGYDVTFEIPANIPSGSYRYRRIVDEVDLVLERNEFNSVNLGPLITITQGALPDLIPSPNDPLISSTANAVQAGDTFTVSALVQNSDSPTYNIPLAAAPSFSVRFFLQPLAGTNPELERVTLGSATATGTTAVGANRTVTLTTSIPSMNAGSYRLGYEIDPDDLVAERPDLNNVAVNPTSSVFQVLPSTPQLPDLIVADIEPQSASGVFNKLIAVQVTIANIGNEDADVSELQLSLSPDAIANNSDAILTNTIAVPELSDGEVVTLEMVFTLPMQESSSSVGSFYWVAEAGRNLVESDETNNFHVLTKSLFKLSTEEESLLPELDIDAHGATPSTIPPGKTATAYTAIINEGGLAASQVEVEVYLSSSPQFTPASDLLLHSFPRVDLAGFGGYESMSHEIQIPPNTTPGNYHLLWVIDPDAHIPTLEDEPVTASQAIQVRPLALGVEVLERSGTTDTLAIFDTEEGESYSLFATSDLSNWGTEEVTFNGGLDGTVVLELDNNTGGELLPTRFFQVQENE